MTAVRDSIEADVIEQIHIRSGIPKSQITLDAEVYRDLSVYGMDLYEIVHYLNKKYDARFDSFRIHDYGPPEVPGIWLWIWKRVSGQQKSYKSLPVKSLIEAVQRGAWFDGSTSNRSG